MKFFLIVLLSLFTVSLSGINTYACSINEFVPFEFRPNEYVFFGEVIGYTEKHETNFKSYNRTLKFVGYGLKAKVENSINLPILSETIEVFRTYPRDTTCAPNGVSLENLKKDFPIGTEIRVVGRENTELLGTNANSIPIIEVSSGNQGQLFKNTGKKEKF